MRQSRTPSCVLWLLSAVIVGATASAGAASGTDAAATLSTLVKGPSLVPDQPTGDVGEVVKGDRPTFAFRIRNAGDEELVIDAVLPSCGCTSIEADHHIPPGGVGTIKAILDTLNLN